MTANQSLQRAFQVLEYINDHPGSRCRDVVAALGLATPTASRFLLNLSELGYLRNDHGTWRPSARLAGLGRGFLPSDAAATIQGALAELADATGTTAFFVACDGDEAVYIHRSVATRSAFASTKRIGARAPLYCTGVGKLFLAERDDAAVRDYATNRTLHPFTPHTATTADELLRRVVRARRDGWAADDEECELGLRCLAVPVRHGRLPVKSAISISGPKSALGTAPTEAQRQALEAAAAAIAPVAELGAW